MSGSPSKSPVRTVSGATNAAMEPVTPQSESGIRMELVVGEKPPNYTGKSDSSDHSIGGNEKESLVENAPSLQAQEHTPETKSGVIEASFNVINSIIGSGIIGVPFALKQAGIGLGVILIILVAVMTDYSVDLLILSGEMQGVYTYQDVLKSAYGKPGFAVITFMQFTNPFLAMTSYMVIVGDTITKIVKRVGGEAIRDSILSNRQFIVFLFTVLVTLPLSLYRNIAKLGKWSGLSIMFLLFITGFIIYEMVAFGPKVKNVHRSYDFAHITMVQSISILAVAYVFHHNAFLVLCSLRDRSSATFAKVVHVSVSFAVVLSLIFGICGFMTFGDRVQGDLFENYCYDDDLANVARFVFTITVVLTYPIECFVAREVVENLFFPNKEKEIPLWRHVLVTVILVAFTVVISMLTDCLGLVLQLNGSLTAIPMVFILPALCFIKARPEPLRCWKNIIPIFLIIFGVLVAITSFIFAIRDMQRGDTCSHGEEMDYCLSPSPAGVNGTPTGNYSNEMTSASSVITTLIATTASP